MSQKSGIYLINKPSGITSNDLIQKLKRKFQIKKIGHAGTLDPLATGIMVILVNQATKISNYLLSKDKIYNVTMKLFIQTDSDDITGTVLKEETPRKFSKKEITDVVNKYDGYMYEQYPPIYSAVKVEGKKLYEYARNNQSVEIKPRTVTINSCKLLDYNSKLGTIKLSVSCSKGTYIRSLVKDIAKDLSTISTVKELERVASGEFFLTEAKTIEEVTENNIISIYDGLIQNKQVLIEYHKIEDIKQGKAITLVNINLPIVFIIDDKKNVIAIYRWVAHELYACQRGLWEVDDKAILTDAERSNFNDIN